MSTYSFGSLKTVIFQEKMKPAALRIYQKVFPGCSIEDLRDQGVNVHILDKEFGIDALLHLKGGQWISIQEKYRKNKFIKYLDFTQEYMNGYGTNFETQGEWFKLGAQLYFYGWANKEETGFEKWVIIDIAMYKALVDRLGGLDKIGRLAKNRVHGSATFYVIDMKKLLPCCITDYRKFL